MSDDKEHGTLITDEEWIAHEVFLRSQKKQVYPQESLLIEEISEEEARRLWESQQEAPEIQDEDIISTEDIKL